MSDEFRDAQLRLYRTQARWEPLKGVAALAAAAAVFMGFVLAGINWLRPPAPQMINVHLDQPLQIQMLPPWEH